MSNIVQGLWIGHNLPLMQRLSIKSFLQHGHQYHLYTYEDLGDVPKGTTICDASTILPRDSIFVHKHGFGKGSYSTFSNLFRYVLIARKGGWWVDTDVVCLRRFDFDDEFVFASEYDEDNDRRVLTSTCALKSPPGCDYLDYCIKACNAKNKEELKWSEIGPYLFDEAIRQFDLKSYRRPVDVFNPIHTWEITDIVRPGLDVSRLTNSHAVHLWNQVWKSSNIDPDGSSHPDSLYALLNARYQ